MATVAQNAIFIPKLLHPQKQPKKPSYASKGLWIRSPGLVAGAGGAEGHSITSTIVAGSYSVWGSAEWRKPLVHGRLGTCIFSMPYLDVCS